MKRVDILKRAARNLRQAKGRTLLTALAIGVGSFTIMMSLAAGAGTREYSKNLIESNIDTQTMLITKKSNIGDGMSSQRKGLQEYNSNIDTQSGMEMMTQQDVEKLQSRKEVEWVIPYYQLKTDWVTFEGMDKKYSMDMTLYDPYIKGDALVGSLPDKGQSVGQNEVVVPEDFAKVLGKQPQELIGKKVTVIVSRPAKTMSQEEAMKLYMTGGEDAVKNAIKGETKEYALTIRAVTRSNSSSQMMSNGNGAKIDRVVAKDISDFTTAGTDYYQKYPQATMRIRDNYKPSDLKESFKNDGYETLTAQDMQQIMFQFVNVLQYIVTGFGILALIASIFGIINTQYISVLERTSQIGLMKALGMPNRGVGKLFRYEAAWIGFLGGVVGIFLAWVAVFFLNPWVTSVLNLGDGNRLLKFEWPSALLLIVLLIVIAIVAGWFPSRKAAKLDPIEALRTE